MSQLTEIKKHYLNQFVKLPDFIESSSVGEQLAYNNLIEISNNILSLLSNKVATTKQIKDISLNCSELLDGIFFILEEEKRENKFLMYCDRIIELMDLLQEDLLEREMFESLENLKKFDDSFHYRN